MPGAVKVDLKIKGLDETKKLVERADAAVKELKDCLWELSKVSFELELSEPAQKE